MLVVTPHRSMRREEQCVAGGASRSGGGGEAQGEKARVQNFSYTTKFGWVFPRSKARRQSVIDPVWLREFSQDIETLHLEIQKQTAFANCDENPNQKVNNLRTEHRSECSALIMNCEDRISASEMTTNPHVSKNASVHTCGLESSGDSCREVAGGEGNLGACSSEQGSAKVKVQVLTHDGESSGSEKSFVMHPRFNTYPGGAKCDEYSSMHSDISRDSGIYSLDDSSIISEHSGDKSLLQEIGDVLGDQDMSLEPCIHCGSASFEDIIAASKENASRSVWLTRFSSSNDLTAEWGSHEWEVEQSPEMSPLKCISPVTRRKNCVLEDSGSHVTSPTTVDDEEEGLKVKQCVACEKRSEESPLRQPPSQHVSELANVIHSFQGLSTRIEDLRLGLECMLEEVSESKRDYINIEKRTDRLLDSTVTSRHRLTRVRALQLLEDRLQEEWWAAYDPSSVSSDENYIV